MGKPLTKSQIVAKLADKLQMTKKQVNEFLNEFVALAYKEAKNSFVIPGLGKLLVKKQKARKGRNPQTGEEIKIPAKNVVKFRIAKACKDAVLKK